MYGWRAKIGVLIPSTNTTVEMDFHRMAPEGVSVHTERLLFKPNVSMEAVDEQTRDLERAAESVATAKMDLILYACNATTFYKGLGWDKQVEEIIRKKTNTPAITTSTALIEGLKEMKIKKVCTISPYPEDVEKKFLEFLTASGFLVVKSFSYSQRDVHEIAKITPYSTYRVAREHFPSDMDGVFIATTALRAIEIVEQLEQDLGKPVVAANPASLWYALRKLGLPDRIDGFGELLRRTTRIN